MKRMYYSKRFFVGFFYALLPADAHGGVTKNYPARVPWPLSPVPGLTRQHRCNPPHTTSRSLADQGLAALWDTPDSSAPCHNDPTPKQAAQATRDPHGSCSAHSTDAQCR